MNHHSVLRTMTKLLMPPIMLFALYVQFHGDYGPGGGFQAGVIFAVAFILFALIFGPVRARRVAPAWVTTPLTAIGVLLYAGVGVVSLLLGGEFLNYDVLAHDPHHGQHLGILLVELGVGITVWAVMVSIFMAFVERGAAAHADGILDGTPDGTPDDREDGHA
ncbi:Na(+)/H(+) antiporter subunit B [Roseospira visakhapatnamensis]|uniref:Multicomponent Na+:H+ antiporter subunit B n=1 Tax=Roseospira visakhapatnamensis TaxID=390880 RepID=A0A7W6RCY9_9PROT|nr:Na(+)/H(+) antiporter subunit B [Roseospira visakhapatnamensis]MBB4266183.1 multicomponent Na+:H+ antiporter subunit B [Roseospira visakhapatnamensis]